MFSKPDRQTVAFFAGLLLPIPVTCWLLLTFAEPGSTAPARLPPPRAVPRAVPPGPGAVTGLTVLRVRPGTPLVTLRRAVARMGGTLTGYHPRAGLARARFPQGPLATAQGALRPVVKSVEPERLYHAMGPPVLPDARFLLVRSALTPRATALLKQRERARYLALSRRTPAPPGLRAMGVPNDPLFARQWGLQDTWPGIRCPTAWEKATGRGVVVAILDTGIRRDAPDLAGTSIQAGFNEITQTPQPTDDNGHGTHVAGTIAQTTNNNLACAGVAYQATLLPVKVLDSQGTGSNYTIDLGLHWATDHGAAVISMSLGGGDSPALHEGVQYAVNRGVTVVAAAGNGSVGQLAYPAGYPESIAVGALDSSGRRASFSQYGPNLAVMAPGVGILQQTISPQTGQFYIGNFSGTSMATPHVSGTVALLKQLSPSLKPASVKAILTRTAHPIGGAGFQPTTGYGGLDAAAAVASVGGGTTPPPPPPPAGYLASQVFELVNQVRKEQGDLPVARNSALDQAAAGWSSRMATEGFFAHVGPDGSSPSQRMVAAGYRPAHTWGENIAAGYRTAQAVMNAWMNSPGHRANILNPAFKDIGIGVAQGGTYGIYWTQDFGG